MTRTDSFWVGSLAMTVALASREPDPQPILRSALREFLRENEQTELAALLRQTLKEKP